MFQQAGANMIMNTHTHTGVCISYVCVRVDAHIVNMPFVLFICCNSFIVLPKALGPRREARDV